MKSKKYDCLSNKSPNFRLYFDRSWKDKGKDTFVITVNNVKMNLGGREARMLHSFLNKVY